IDEERAVDLVRRARLEQPADLGRYHVILPVDLFQQAADTLLGEAEAVERRRIEIAHPRIPCRLQGRIAVVLGERTKVVAERRRAKPHAGEGKFATAA